ncbi:disease resistance protein Roq1 isoform X2 [Cryptomeria japonica]|nr:disease resistance protein Roq1 isoform X2 [Cryptomeria japonica]XP_057854728.2 disease resistance protein Roq1 isoform X2 [Cryptomeria japonica]
MSTMVKEKQKRKIPFQVAKYAVGLDELVKDFHSHCQTNGQMRDKIIGIFGMGGSGKTTLAKDLFNSKHSEFCGSTILFDVRENHVRGKLTSLQSKLLNDLERKKNQHEFCSLEDGIAVIKDYFHKSPESKFLVFIDDVDHKIQLDALLPIDALNHNSLVIVTTRDERLLIQAGVRVRYKMKEMNPRHSRELFCWHAFHRQSCKIGFDKLVDSFVQVCGGLPLALQVMGGHVFGSDKACWQIQLDAVKARLHKDIKDTLKISYDALEEDQKQIFMDIACFFIGEDVSKAKSIWKASGWRAEHALRTLKAKCLVEVETCFDRDHIHLKCHYEPEFILRMHDNLRDLGREMADNEMSHPRRLWRPEDRIGMTKIKGFQDTLTGSEGKSLRCYSVLDDIESGLYMRYFLGSSKTSTYLQWLQLESACKKYPSIPEWFPLQNLHTLSLQRVSPAILWHRGDQVSLKLKELYCKFESVHFSNFNHDVLMTHLNELVSSFGTLTHLESLHLKFDRPNPHRSGLTRELNIESKRLLKSVRELVNLKSLELASFATVDREFAFSNRGEATDDRFCMRSLEAISLCVVCNTRKVSIHGQFCPTLKSLKICSMRDLREVDLTGLTTLESLVLLKCGKLRKVLSNYMPELEMFHIKLCRTMKQLPNFGQVGCLKRITISRCLKLQDISAIERLKGLKRIWIAFCPMLKSIKAIEQLKGLKRIWIEECRQLEGVICFKELKELKRIFIGGCITLQKIQDIKFLVFLESIIIARCPKLQNIQGIEELKGLKEMIIAVCPIISFVERLQRLPSELTILAGRMALSDPDEVDSKWASLMSDLNEIGGTLSMATHCFCEIESDRMSREKVEEMMDSFHKTLHSLSTFIFCAMFWEYEDRYEYPCIGSDICNGTRIMFDRSRISLRPASLSFVDGWMIYMCVVNEERLSKYDSWMPSFPIEKAFVMGVEAGEERKTLQILQTIFAQPYVNNGEYCEDLLRDFDYNFDFDVDDGGEIDYDDLAEYVDDDEEYDGAVDDD